MAFEHEYTTAEAIQQTGLSESQLRRSMIKRHMRTRRAGRATFYHADDIDALATERGRSPTRSTSDAPPRTEIMPSGELFQCLPERQEKLDAALLEIGRLQGTLESQRKLLDDHERLQGFHAQPAGFFDGLPYGDEDGQQMRQRAAELVERPHHQHIAGLDTSERLDQARPTVVGGGRAVLTEVARIDTGPTSGSRCSTADWRLLAVETHMEPMSMYGKPQKQD